MALTDSEIKKLEKLVNDIPLASLNTSVTKRRLTKKHARKKAPAHIRPHTLNGKTYYYFIRGADKEVYLGTADFIYEAVKEKRKRKGVNEIC